MNTTSCRIRNWALPWVLSLAATCSLHAAPATLTVDADKPGHAISPMLYGIFFEDINCSADGGLYAELVRNRNFEDAEKPDQWSVLSSGLASVEMSVDTSRLASAKNPRSLKVSIAKTGAGRVGIANNGFWGMSLKKDETYELSLLARGGDGFTGPLLASLESSDGVVYAQTKITALT
ncbi:MAG TPA: hypothetical protein VNT26_03285, partial [Candidatus Sulfotelmatobacter sp.]|nr:hypothetical protein [Candidatus Sulfotelmatobacter sp.]